MSRKTILIIASEFPPGPGGIGNHAYSMARSLTDEGEIVAVWTPANEKQSENEKLLDNQLSFQVTRYVKSGWKILTYMKLLFNINKAIADNKEVKLITSGMIPLMLGGLLKLLFNTKCQMTVVTHGLDINSSHPVISRMVKLSLKKYDHIIAVSKFTASKLPSTLINKINVINNGIDLDRLQKLTLPGETKAKLLGNPSLITVGTIWERKGQINVVKAMPEILKKYPEAHYHMIGLPNDIQPIKEAVNNLQLEEHITIHGAVSDLELIRSLSGADIFIMLSVATPNGDFEGFGIAILEANYFGVPAIGSKNCGIEDAINDEVTGLLIDPNNIDQVVDAVSRIQNNRKEFSDNAKQFSLKLSWKNVINQYLKVLKS